MTTKVKIGAMWPQAKEHHRLKQLPEAKKGVWKDSPSEPQKGTCTAECEIIHSCCFKLPVCGTS